MQKDEEKEKPKRTRSYVEEAFRQIQEKDDIEDILIVNQRGVPVKTTMEHGYSIQFAGLYENLRGKVATFMQSIDPPQELKMLRVRTKAHEVLVTPDGHINVFVVQNPKDNFVK